MAPGEDWHFVRLGAQALFDRRPSSTPAEKTAEAVAVTSTFFASSFAQYLFEHQISLSVPRTAAVALEAARFHRRWSGTFQVQWQSLRWTVSRRGSFRRGSLCSRSASSGSGLATA